MQRIWDAATLSFIMRGPIRPKGRPTLIPRWHAIPSYLHSGLQQGVCVGHGVAVDELLIDPDGLLRCGSPAGATTVAAAVVLLAFPPALPPAISAAIAAAAAAATTDIATITAEPAHKISDEAHFFPAGADIE